MSITITLTSEDTTIELPYEVAILSETVKGLLEDKIDLENPDDVTDEDKLVPLSAEKVSGALLTKIGEFCTHYHEEAMTPIEFNGKKKFDEIVTQQWYHNFISEFSGTDIIPLIKAADYLHLPPLLHLSILKMSSTILGKTEHDMREFFNIAHP
mmetsp:Transcript_18207/g.22301  ORF Transcript_18207/g.22301 Transcript_18207/m.22301 type:complete len:154 (-) Transcript_18207:134-595(-)